MKKLIKIVLISLIVFFITGCDNRKCIESHEEESRCCFSSCHFSGKVMLCVPICNKCIKNVCDKYEEE